MKTKLRSLKYWWRHYYAAHSFGIQLTAVTILLLAQFACLAALYFIYLNTLKPCQ
jgi:hypothetical protein